MSKNISIDLLNELEILKEDISNELYLLLENFGYGYEYVYYDKILGSENLSKSSEYGNSKEDFDKIFKLKINESSLTKPIMCGYIEHDAGFVIEIVKNPEEKNTLIDSISNKYIDSIFKLLSIKKENKIHFKAFVSSFILVSDKYSNYYDNNIYDLDMLSKDEEKLNFIKRIFS